MSDVVKMKLDEFTSEYDPIRKVRVASTKGILLNPEVVYGDAMDWDLVMGAFDEEDLEPNGHGVPNIEEVMHKGKTTIIRWADGTKTAVVCGEGDVYDPYVGFTAAIVKKMFGSTNKAMAVHDEKNLEQVDAKRKAAEDAVRENMERAARENLESKRQEDIKNKISEAVEQMLIEALAREGVEKWMRSRKKE